MRNVIFVAPFPLETTLKFVRAAASLSGVRLLGIVAEPPQGEDARRFADIVTVSDPLDARQLIEAAKLLQARHGRIHRVLGILEPIQVQIAEIRRALGVEGTSPEVADLFRDKGRMKDELRRHGLPCARHQVLSSFADAEEFVARVGFPIVIKPTAGMGCKATWRVSSMHELRDAVAASHVSVQHPAIAEEFLKGREYSFETITIGGEVRFQSVTRYFPTPLEVMENPWIQWCVVHPRDITGPEFDDARALGVRAVKALGLETGFTHMEWFRRNDGSLAIGEIAARPPGAHIVAGNNFVHNADLHRAWARAVVDDAFDGPFERKYSVGVAFLRGIGNGRVASVSGVAETNAKVAPIVVESKLPRIGAPKSDSYEGDGYIVVRHPDTDVVKSAMQAIISTIRVEYA
jgi:biotin carboxylase